MIPWWGVLIFVVVLKVCNWAGRYFLFRSTKVLFRNLKNELFGGGKDVEQRTSGV